MYLFVYLSATTRPLPGCTPQCLQEHFIIINCNAGNLDDEASMQSYHKLTDRPQYNYSTCLKFTTSPSTSPWSCKCMLQTQWSHVQDVNVPSSQDDRVSSHYAATPGPSSQAEATAENVADQRLAGMARWSPWIQLWKRNFA